jgi:hypothetical protein
MPGRESQLKAGESPQGGAVQSPHGGGTAVVTGQQNMIRVIQNGTLAGYKKMKIGEAFEKYRFFKKKQWTETRGDNSNFYVDFIGYDPSGIFDLKSKKEDVSARGIEVKFVIYLDGSYGVGMVSKIEKKRDGTIMRYPLADSKSVLDAIYSNRKISY